MPTINQLVRQGRTSAVKKSTAPVVEAKVKLDQSLPRRLQDGTKQRE